jgi:hypothetical protein
MCNNDFKNYNNFKKKNYLFKNKESSFLILLLYIYMSHDFTRKGPFVFCNNNRKPPIYIKIKKKKKKKKKPIGK